MSLTVAAPMLAIIGAWFLSIDGDSLMAMILQSFQTIEVVFQ